MISILKAEGLNKYKVSHMKKHRLEGTKLPSQTVRCRPRVY
ncbi:hypothetical protein Patl1_25875 [Pistacia atlantica]|uniref:Uncharacterized protein n=1 Tax=Pistacia atlantica TaxID=434234 RepID=A0ACC1B2P3_9ROSI|nr:hypothetical protein Patl1_25875 [Pistacia atlantica]